MPLFSQSYQLIGEKHAKKPGYDIFLQYVYFDDIFRRYFLNFSVL